MNRSTRFRRSRTGSSRTKRKPANRSAHSRRSGNRTELARRRKRDKTGQHKQDIASKHGGIHDHRDIHYKKYFRI